MCKLPNCDRPLSTKSAKGLCPGHYQRYRKHGPDFDKSPIGSKGTKVSQYGIPEGFKKCYKCTLVKELDQFAELPPSTRKAHPNLTHNAQCLECSSMSRRSLNARRMFGHRGVILDSQRISGAGCSNCGRNDIRIAIDHDHSCCPEVGKSCGKCVRDLLCSNCNTILGLCKDSPDILRDLATYVEKWKVVIFQ